MNALVRSMLLTACIRFSKTIHCILCLSPREYSAKTSGRTSFAMRMTISFLTPIANLFTQIWQFVCHSVCIADTKSFEIVCQNCRIMRVTFCSTVWPVPMPNLFAADSRWASGIRLEMSSVVVARRLSSLLIHHIHTLWLYVYILNDWFTWASIGKSFCVFLRDLLDAILPSQLNLSTISVLCHIVAAFQFTFYFCVTLNDTLKDALHQMDEFSLSFILRALLEFSINWLMDLWRYPVYRIFYG